MVSHHELHCIVSSQTRVRVNQTNFETVSQTPVGMTSPEYMDIVKSFSLDHSVLCRFVSGPIL